MINANFIILTSFKAIEVEAIKFSGTVFKLSFEWTFKRDHAGAELQLGALGIELSIKLYDTRHWDYTNNRWEVYEPSISLEK